jgi:hypothetical protein
MNTIDIDTLATVTGGTMLPREAPPAESAPGSLSRFLRPAEAVKGLNLGDLIKAGGGGDHTPQEE